MRKQFHFPNFLGVANERVVQFVMESGLHVTISDFGDSDYENNSEAKNTKKSQQGGKAAKTDIKHLTFFSGTTARVAFIEAFDVASKAFRGSGFALL